MDYILYLRINKTVLLDLVLNQDLLSYIRNFRMIIAGKSCPDRVTLKSRMAF